MRYCMIAKRLNASVILPSSVAAALYVTNGRRFDTQATALTKQGHKIAPYITLNNPLEPRSGFNDGASKPRFSTGYGALWNRSALLVETHDHGAIGS